MRKLEVIKELEDGLFNINELIKRAKGEYARCYVKSLEDSVLYIQTWIRHPIEKALNEIKRK